MYVCVCVCVCTRARTRVHIVVSAYPQKHQPSFFFAKPLINQKIVNPPPPPHLL